MIIVGGDVHKKTHTFVAVDQAGRKLAGLTVPATSVGHAKALGWALRLDSSLLWALEDCRAMSARLEIDLLTAGQRVVRVPARLAAGHRAGSRVLGKSDPIDAFAVAWAALRHPDLPAAIPDEASRAMKLLVDRRDQLVAWRTTAINQLRWHLHRIDPGIEVAPRSLDRAKTLTQLAGRLADEPGIDARLARELVGDITGWTVRINQFEAELATMVADQAPALLELPGCGVLTAAKIIGETAGIGRFATESRYAMHAGTAPIPVWSGATAGRVRLNRSGNRQLNAALHRIAITQLRLGGDGRAYYDKHIAAGHDSPRALRCLKRRLARIVYNTLTRQTHTAHDHLPTAA